jgi:hypothetical protein
MTDTMTSQNNVLSSWDTLYIFKFEIEFTKRSAAPTIVSGRIQQFAIIQNYSSLRKYIYLYAKPLGLGRELAVSHKACATSALYQHTLL